MPHSEKKLRKMKMTLKHLILVLQQVLTTVMILPVQEKGIHTQWAVLILYLVQIVLLFLPLAPFETTATSSMMVPPAGGTRAVEAPMPAIMTLTLIATSTQNLIILSLRKIAPANHGVLKNIMVLRLPVMIKLRASLILQC